MSRILVTPRSMTASESPAVRRLRDAGHEVIMPSPGAQPTREQLLAALPGVEGWVAGVESIDEGILSSSQASSLRVISRNGAGVDAVDVAAAESAGIAVLSARGANARGVAELALGLSIAGFRHLLPSVAALGRGEWVRGTGRELAGSTIGIVGFGAIGRILARMASGCELTVLAHDPFVTSGAPDGVELVPLATLLGRSDIISLHLPPLPQGALLDAVALASVKPNALVVNTARASLVDSDAMFDALESGRVSGYAVDAFDHEPPELDRLLLHPRVIASPHLGAATLESIERASQAAVTNLIEALDR